MGRDGLVFVNVRKDIVKLKRKANLSEAGFMEHGKGTTNRWSTCKITGRPLDRPVFDELGYLYNKDSVIELLIDRKKAKKAAEAAEKSEKKSKKKKRKGRLMLKDNVIPAEIHKNSLHIRDLSDICELRVKLNPNYRENTTYNTLSLGHANASTIEQGFVKQPKFLCPVSDYPLNGAKPFFANWNCGHSVCETVLKEVEEKLEKKQCCICEKPYKPIDLIRINPIHPEHKKKSSEQFKKRRRQRLLKAKLDKKYKKEMKLLKNRVKTEKLSSSESEYSSDYSDSSSDSDSSDSTDSDASESGPSSSRPKKIKREVKKEELNDVKTETIEIESDSIEVPSSGEENERKAKKEADFQEFLEREKSARDKLAAIEALIRKKQFKKKNPDSKKPIVLSDSD